MKAVASLIFIPPGFGPEGTGLNTNAIKDPPNAFGVRGRKIRGSESPVVGL